MNRALLAVAAVAGIGCARSGGVEASAAASWSFEGQYPVPPAMQSWTEYVSIDGVVTLRLDVRQQWARASGGDAPSWWVVETQFDGTTERVRAKYQVGVRDGAFGYLATARPDGSVEAWEPMEQVLPRNAAGGAEWTADHRKGDRAFSRDCELRSSERCADGVVSVCEVRGADRRTVMREHFCPGVGWAGYESLHFEGEHVERRWSEG